MTLPQVAIVGRPNVGKSSLFNRLARQRVSIVDPTPGVTRDRVTMLLELDPPVEAPAGAEPRLIELVDTGGWGVYTAEGSRYDNAGEDLTRLTPDIEAQINIAWEQAQLILFVIDSQSGITALDRTIATMLRQKGSADRVMVIASKADSDKWIPHGLEAAALGLGEPLCVSATSGQGMRSLLDTLYERIQAVPEARSVDDAELKIAIVGKRNAGKSTLINFLAGEERVIVSEIAGTTRDSVDVRFEIEGRRVLAIDTAGVRKRKSFADDVEYYAYHRMLKAIRRADVVVLLLDATDEVAQVEKKLSLELQRQFKPTVIVVNKVDLLDQDRIGPDDYLDYLTEQLRGLEYAPIVFASGKSGEGVRDAIAMAMNLHQQAGHRESTGRLNRIVESILHQRGPSSRLGSEAKLYYASQVGVHPPTIVLKVNHPKLFEGQYERYLMNRLREELPFSEVPFRLVFTTRDRKSLEELKQQGRSRRKPAENV